jgi:transglutaminase-like putative cysteine protease
MNRLSSLPRDARDTLFLLGVIIVVLAPQVAYLPWWCSVLATAVLAWRGTLAWQNRPLPAKAWLVVLMAVTIGATWITHRSLLGREAGVTLIVVLLTLKTLELRARRDAYVVFFLGFFTMLTSFFNSQSLPMAAAILLGLTGLLTALVNAHMPVGKPPLALAAKTTLTMMALGAPVMLVLFLLFPRLAPLWGIPNDAMTGRSGLSAQMQVGAIGSLALDDSIAMRVRFKDPVPPQGQLYFRGPVLSVFDGRTWQSAQSRYPALLIPAAELQVQGAPVDYEVTLQPTLRPWLLLLDAADQPPVVPGHEVRMDADLLWHTVAPITDLLRYQARSHTEFRHGPLQSVTALQVDLDLPLGYNPRTLALAAQLRQDPALARADSATLVQAVLQRLRSGGYQYTLDPGVSGRDSADEFWFDKKEGFCEHIASAFVILMRALGVPARIVTGYQGGEVNPVDGFWVLRQSDAHAWTEVWQAGRGWVRVDPTAAVAPGRIGSLQRLQAPRGLVASAFNSVFGEISPNALLRIRAAWEALNNGWNQWVLSYTQSRQLKLLQDIGFAAPRWEDLLLLLAVLLAAAALIGAAWTLWERRQSDPWLRLLQRVRQRLLDCGLQLGGATPPRQMAMLLQQRFGIESTAPLRAWLLRLEAQRYAARGDNTDRRELTQLKREFRRLPWPSA